MSDKLDKINNALMANTKPILPVPQDDIKLTQDAEEDYNLARDNLKNLLNKSDEALDHMMQVAAEAEHPRAFEVLSGLIKNVADVNDKLMDLNKKHKDITDAPKAIENKTTNNLFVGSTAELQKLLKKNEENDLSNVVDITPRLNDNE